MAILRGPLLFLREVFDLISHSSEERGGLQIQIRSFYQTQSFATLAQV